MSPIYFDYAATTPLDPRVFSKMEPYLKGQYGNPSSIYTFAQHARHALDDAREKVAIILGCHPKEILFTGSGTESNNLAIYGIAEAYASRGKHIVTTRIEHDSTLEPLKYLETKGFEVTYVEVGEDGIVEVEDIMKAVRDDTILISVMYANNEIGTVQPIANIAKCLDVFYKEKKTAKPFFHTDACQAAAFLDLSAPKLGVDLMTINGGKIHGPKGVGALYIKKGIKLVPQIRGGGQEYRMRAGTENIAGIVGLGEALCLAQEEKKEVSKKLLPLRDRIIDEILLKIPKSRLNGDRYRRLPNNINVSFYGLEGEPILLRLDMLGIYASAGSACTSGSLEPSHVIQALGISEEWVRSSLRITLGKENTEEEVDFLLEKLPGMIAELRETSPF